VATKKHDATTRAAENAPRERDGLRGQAAQRAV
jgi:hypothetical protein